MISQLKYNGTFVNDSQRIGNIFDSPMVKQFRLTYLAKGWGWGGVGGGTPLEVLTISCLTFYLLLADRPILGLPEYKLKVVNIC